jgi:WD40 repeat protein
VNIVSGQVVRGYELHELLGLGGFGAVYRAYQPAVKRDVAIKIILPQYANQPDFIRSFETEAQLVARLEHLHIVPLYDYWREPSGAYLVMRWLRGGSLRGRLKRGPLDLDQAAMMLEQTAGALTVAHRRGVVHRDIKPDNILLDEDGNTFLTDFGVAQEISAAQEQTDDDSDVFAGSLTYTSPEQIRGEPATPATDIYSLGIVLYEALTAEHPFPNAQPAELITKHLGEPLPELRDRYPELSSEIDAVIQRATSKTPEARFSDPITMAAAFRRALKATKRRTALIDSVGVQFVPIDTTPTPFNALIPEIETPYKGLRSFQEADAAEFYGRESLIEHLLTQMAADEDVVSRFLAVVGPSGSGKSSVVMAGVVPALRAGGLSGSRSWFFATMTPGQEPFSELEAALLSVAVTPPDNLYALLTRDEYGLHEAVKALLPEGEDACLLLVVDQFEEIFSMVEDEDERTLFLKSLWRAVIEPDSNFRLVVTLRADYYDRPLMYPGFGDLMRRRTEVVLPLSLEELQRAIVEPALHVGVDLEPGLVTAIVTDLSEQPGALPLLQYALTELFERRQGRVLRLDTYHNIGGALGALAQRADELFEGLDDAGKAAAQQLFLRLVAIGEGENMVRRRRTRAELLSLVADENGMAAVIDSFGRYRLLTFDRDPATRVPTIEIAHEALIRQWGRLRGWLEQHRDELMNQRRLGTLVEEWENARRDASFLARGNRLEQLVQWAEQTTLALNTTEAAFLDASIRARDVRLAEEEAQRQREASLEQRSRNRLRVLALVLLISTVGALGLTTVALNQSEIAQRNAVTATYAQGEAFAEAANAQTQAAIAQLNAVEARSLALAASSQLALNDGNSDLAVLLGLEANRIASPQQARLALAEIAYSPGTRRELRGHNAAISDVAISPNERLAAAGARDGKVLIWNVNTGEIIARFEGHNDRVTAVAFSPDGDHLLTASTDGMARLWDIASGTVEQTYAHLDPVMTIAFSPGGRSLVTGDSNGLVRLWDTASGAEQKQFRGHNGSVNALAYSPDSRYIVSGGMDRTVRVWSIATTQETFRFTGHSDRVTTVAFNPNNRMVASGSSDNTIRLWSLQTGAQIAQYSGHTDTVTHIVFAPGGLSLLSTSWDASMILWNIETGQQMQRFLGHRGAISSAVISADGDLAVSGSDDTTVRVWELNSNSETRRYRHYVDEVSTLAVSPDGRTAITGGENNSFVLWEIATGSQVRRFTGHTAGVVTVKFSRNGQQILSSAMDGSLILWDAATGAEIRRLTGHTDVVSAIDFNIDGETVLTASWDRTLMVWQVADGTPLHHYEGAHEDRILAASFSVDGHSIISGANDGTLVLWDVDSGEVTRHFEGTRSPITSIAVNPDGRTFLAGSADGVLRRWDITNGSELQQYVGHRSSVLTVAITPDGTTALSGSRDRSLILWDVDSGAQIYRFEGHEDAVTSVAFIRGGLAALSGSRDRTVRMWRTLTLDSLVQWMYANRYVPTVDCSTQARFRIEALCDALDPDSQSVNNRLPY